MLVQDPDESAVLTLVLQRVGCSVRAAKTMDDLNRIWSDQPIDLVLLVGPTPSLGMEVRQIRAQAAAPIVVVTEKLGETDQIGLYEDGVDLAVSRPYSARLLIAQLRALLRRSAGTRIFSLPELTQGAVSLDPTARTVQVDGDEPQRLTQLEFRLMYTLMLSPGHVIPSEQLVEHVWGYTGEGDRTLVRGLVKRLRGKVEADPGQPRHILTEPGVGYLFRGG
jgi:DNA-binding response OmpR family regulator